jgi:hypothetical protein
MPVANITWGEIRVASEMADVDLAAKHLQDIAGITAGDLAGQLLPIERWRWFTPATRIRHLMAWLQAEEAHEKHAAKNWGLFPVGSRVVLIDEVDNYPTIYLKPGPTGTVTSVDIESTWVRLDQHRPELDEWQNGLQIWHDFYEPAATFARLLVLDMGDGDRLELTLDRFCQENDTTAAERYEIEKDIARCGEHVGGGGAQPIYTLKWATAAAPNDFAAATEAAIAEISEADWAEIKRDHLLTGGARH